MAYILSFSNQKGGVGKTTSCVNIASAIADEGKKVLLIDYDPQGNATSGLGVDKKSLKYTLYDVLHDNSLLSYALIHTEFSNLDLLPSDISLASAVTDFSETFSLETNPLNFLNDIKYDYDYICIDCPPSLGFLTVSPLSLSDGVVIPLQCEFYSLEGLSQLIPTIRKIRDLYNPSLSLVGILPTMYNGRLTLSNQVIAEIKKYYPGKLFSTTISRSIRLSEASGYGKPIQYLDPKAKNAKEYASVAHEILERT